MHFRTALLAVGLALWALPVQAAVLYSQPSNHTGANASQNDTTPGGFGGYSLVLDNFTLAENATLTSLSWNGSYFGIAGPQIATGFSVAIFADSGGAPDLGTTIFDQSIAGNANETFVGLDVFGNNENSYSDTGLSVALTGGTPYWLAIQADVAFPPQWGWEAGSGGNGSSHQIFFDANTVIPFDFAFTLTGTPAGVVAVPEPTGLIIFGSGIVGMIGFLGMTGWRRRKDRDTMLPVC